MKYKTQTELNEEVQVTCQVTGKLEFEVDPGEFKGDARAHITGGVGFKVTLLNEQGDGVTVAIPFMDAMTLLAESTIEEYEHGEASEADSA